MVNTWISDQIFFIELNRPKKSNCYNFEMCLEMKNAFNYASQSKAMFVFITARGENFCTGADLSWLRQATDITIIKEMYESLLAIEIPVLSHAKGAIRGGGLGLIACSDIVFCEDNTTFSLSEAQWGLIPGIITPMLITKIGISNFMELALTARIFNFDEALSINLVHHKISNLNSIMTNLKKNSTSSSKIIKKMGREDFFSKFDLEKYLQASSKMISDFDFQERVKKIIKN